MRAARIVIMFIISFAQYYIVSGQIDGREYLSKDGLGSTVVKFNNNRFTLERGSSLGPQAFKSKGYYFFAQDTLILVHEKTEIKTSSFEYDTLSESNCGTEFKECPSELFRYNFKVKESNGQPLAGVAVLFYNKDGYLFSKATDDKGLAEIITGKGVVSEIRLRQLGYNILTINPINKSENCCLSFNVELVPSPQIDFNDRVFVQKFKINRSKSKIENLFDLYSKKTFTPIKK